ncbi:MAG: hypothetical protein KC425_21550 [Anaerolineales bacterium]|nr:hypothetical protein [Anaerolineales bacterium]
MRQEKQWMQWVAVGMIVFFLVGMVGLSVTLSGAPGGAETAVQQLVGRTTIDVGQLTPTVAVTIVPSVTPVGSGDCKSRGGACPPVGIRP